MDCWGHAVESRRLVAPAVVATLLCFALIGTAPARQVVATEAVAGDCDWTPANEEHAKNLREAVGLLHDDSTVAASYSQPSYSCDVASIPLSLDEQVRFHQVLDAQAELSDLVAPLAEERTFAGAWLDADNLTIASTDGMLGADLRTAKGAISLRKVQFSKSQLDAIAEEIAYLDDNSRLGVSARTITRVSVDERRNQVRVGVHEDLDHAAAALTDAFGAKVFVYFAEIPEGGFLVLHDW